jgi:Tol biopolymer transport system component
MWSPDGRYLAYRRFTDCGSDDSPRPRDVVISDAEGNVLASFPAQGWDIRWSPDSTRVAVWDTFGETIGVYGPDGSRQARLAMPTWWSLPGDYDPSWTPDGTSLIVPSLVGHNVEYDVELPLDGGTPRRLPEGGRIYSPAGSYAPDGSGYVVVDDRALKVIRTDGSGSVTLLTAGRGTDLGEIGFSPEGDRVLFWKSKDGESSLWSVGVDGSDPQLVVAGTTQGQWLVR